MKRAVFLILAFPLLAGCAKNVNLDPPVAEVSRTVQDRGQPEVSWARSPEAKAQIEARVRELLKDLLTVDEAVQVALLNNPDLQAKLASVGISYAELAQAGLMSNPSFALTLQFPTGPASGVKQEYGLGLDFLDVLILPLRKKMARAEFERTKLLVAHEVFSLIHEVKVAFFELLASQQLVQRLELIQDINQASAEFADRQFEAGTLNQLDRQNFQALYNQSRADLVRARADSRVQLEKVNRLLGLWGPLTDWRADSRLPEIPAREISIEDLETLAIERRADLQAARWATTAIGHALSLRKKTRFFPVGIHVGVESERELDDQWLHGPHLRLQLPIFDFGQASVPRLESELVQSEKQLESLAVHVRSEVRTSRDLLTANRDLALYYQNVLLPQRVEILDLTLRHYNMMLKGTYDLLLAKQLEVETERAYIESLKNYWIARADLERAVGGELPAATETIPGEIR